MNLFEISVGPYSGRATVNLLFFMSPCPENHIRVIVLPSLQEPFSILKLNEIYGGSMKFKTLRIVLRAGFKIRWMPVTQN